MPKNMLWHFFYSSEIREFSNLRCCGQMLKKSVSLPNLTNLQVTLVKGTTFTQSSISTLVSPNFAQLRHVNIVGKSIL